MAETKGPSTGLETDSSYSLRRLGQSFERTLKAENKSPRTIETYLSALKLFDEFVRERGMPTKAAAIRREHVEEFVADQLSRYRPSTASIRYRALSAFFNWARDDGEIEASPMVRMKPPAIPETPAAVLGQDEQRLLLRACRGRSFREVRDAAIIRLLIDTGMRRAEITGLMVDDVDFDYDVVGVIGKGDSWPAPNGSIGASCLLQGKEPQSTLPISFEHGTSS